MLTLKVYWGKNNEYGFPLYSVYSGDKYTVELNPEGISKPYTRILVDDGRVDINLGIGSRTYVMNGNGATVDTIFVN